MAGEIAKPFYRKRGQKSKPLQGDIALMPFVQARDRSGEQSAPGLSGLVTAQLPGFEPAEDFDVTPAAGKPFKVRVWQGPCMALHQNCELEYAHSDDSRMLIAPIATTTSWPEGPWDAIRRGELPGYFYLPPLTEQEGIAVGLESAWDEGAVVFASATAGSRKLVKQNRLLGLEVNALHDLQRAFTIAFTVRGFGDLEAMQKLEGKTIARIAQTSETVPGPVRLAKVYLEDDEDGDEISLVWGLRLKIDPNP